MAKSVFELTTSEWAAAAAAAGKAAAQKAGKRGRTLRGVHDVTRDGAVVVDMSLSEPEAPVVVRQSRSRRVKAA